MAFYRRMIGSNGIYLDTVDFVSVVTQAPAGHWHATVIAGDKTTTFNDGATADDVVQRVNRIYNRTDAISDGSYNYVEHNSTYVACISHGMVTISYCHEQRQYTGRVVRYGATASVYLNYSLTALVALINRDYDCRLVLPFGA